MANWEFILGLADYDSFMHNKDEKNSNVDQKQ